MTWVDFDTSRDPTEQEAAWLEFHRANPHVWEAFDRLAMSKACVGDRRGARAVWERLRWDFPTLETDESAPNLNDHYPPYYARFFAHRHPGMADFFSFRTVPEGVFRVLSARPPPAREGLLFR